MTAQETQLHDAVQAAYQAFGRYSAPHALLDVCTACCMDEALERDMRRLPLRQLTDKHFYQYNDSAKSTVQPADEIKYFAPRLLELLAQGARVHHSTELFLDRLGRCESGALSAAERTALQDFALAYFALGLEHWGKKQEGIFQGENAFSILLMWDYAGESCVQLSGGTHNPMAPPFDFLQRAFAPLVRRLGVGLDLQLLRRGFYPAGGGELVAHITPAAQPFKPVDVLERGPLHNAWGEALVPGLARNIATRELEALGQRMGWTFESGQLRQPPTRQNEGPGNALVATLEYEHITEVFCQLGERSLSAEQVAKRLVDEVRNYQSSTGALGPHLADQWMLPLALAVWRSGQAARYTCSEVTQHTATNAQTLALGLPVRVQITPVEQAMLVEISPLP